MGALDDLHAEHCTNLFLSTDYFGEDGFFWPEGVEANKVAVKANVFKDGLIGSNEVSGDGKVLNHLLGREERESCIIELPAATTIQNPQDPIRPDKFEEANGDVWSLKRQIGRDGGTVTVLGVDVHCFSSRGKQISG